MTASIIIISNNNKDIVDKQRLSKVLCIQPSLGYILEVCHLQLLIIVTVLSHSHYSVLFVVRLPKRTIIIVQDLFTCR